MQAFVTFQGAGGGALGGVTIQQLVNLLPGGTSMWDEVQFQSFHIWGAERPIVGLDPEENISQARNWPDINVKFNNTINSNYLGDNPSFVGMAVTNSRRAHVGIVPNQLFKQAWIPSTRTEQIIQVNTQPVSALGVIFEYEFLLEFSCMVRSVQGTIIPELANASSLRPICGEVRLFQNEGGSRYTSQMYSIQHRALGPPRLNLSPSLKRAAEAGATGDAEASAIAR
jgi:hypothetical protein